MIERLRRFLRPLKKLNTLLLIIIAVIICVGTAVIGYSYMQTMKTSLWTQIVNDITEVTAQGGHAFETYVKGDRETLDSLADNLSKYDFSDPKERDEAMLLFNSYAGEDGYFSLVVFGAGEDCTIRLAGTDRTVSAKKSDYKDYGESGITEPYINNYTGQKTLGYYRRITFKDGTTAIVRKGQLMSYITKEFSLSFYNNTGFSYIINREGTILIRPTHKNSNRTGNNLFSILEYNQDDSTEADLLKAAINNGDSGAMLSTAGTEDRVIAFVPLTQIEDWYIVSVIPNSSVSRNIEDVLRSSLAITVIIVLVVIIFILFVLATYLFRRKIVAQAAEVKHREQLFGILASNTEDVFVMLPHGKREAEYISPNISRIMGLDEDKVKADVNVLGINGDEDEEKPDDGEDALQKINNGEPLTYDRARKHKITGETRYFRERVYRASIDGVDKDIIVFSDRTAEKKAETALTDAMETAKAANRAKSSFLSNMSHDIRTPMNAILGFTELIKRDRNDPNKVLQHLSKINASGQHLLGLINDILDMSKIESGKTALNLQSFNFAEFIHEIDAIIRPQAKGKNQEFEIITTGLREEFLIGDKLRINQILINILSNAVKYTHENGRIVMEIAELPRINENFAHLRFTVTDNGMGISEDYLKIIFNPFTRETNSMVNSIQGTGLGMTITKNLVDMFGGKIDVKSAPGKGSTFTVELELRIDRADVNNEFWEEYDITHALVVDDEVDVCQCVQGALLDAGLETEYVTSGREAIETVKAQLGGDKPFNLVMLDLKMPDMNGIETAKALRKIVPEDVFIVLLTAYDWDDYEESARDAGIDIFLPKPFFVSSLKLNIRTLKRERENLLEPQGDIFDGKRCLAAEDNELNAEILGELLDMRGAKCELAENGKVALEMFEKSEKGYYDLILMDVQMPVMNGHEATRRIRACNHPDAKTVPIIAMTANAFAEDVAAAIEAGMNAHIAKPMNMDKLEEVYKEIIKSKKKQK